MQIAIVLYPKFAALDVVGPYEVLGRIPGAGVAFVAEAPGPVWDDVGSLALSAVGIDEVTRPDVILVGGGSGRPDQMAEGRLHAWLRSVDRTSTWTAGVSTGTLILAAAGLLNDRRATTHWPAAGELADLGTQFSSTRVVVDGKYATGAGPTAGIDMALTLAGLIAGDEVAQAIQLIVEYAPEPPYAAGTPQTAPPLILERVSGGRAEFLGSS